MFFASVGRGDGHVDPFLFLLAEKLGRTLSELGDLTTYEVAQWRAFHKVRRQQEELSMLSARHG